MPGTTGWKRKARALAPATVALAVGLGLLVGWPAAATLRAVWEGSGSSLGGGGLIDATPWGASLGRPLGLAFQTLRLVLATTALALPAGVALGLILFRTDAWGRRRLLTLTVLALFVPMPLHATAWLGAIGSAGRSQLIGSAPLLTGWPGAAFIHAMAAIPWVAVLVGVGLRSVEPSLEESALLDLPGWRVVLIVTLRRSVGAIAAAAVAVAVLTAGDMTVTDLLQVRTYAEEVYIQSQAGAGPVAAAKVALPPLIVLGGLIVLGARKLARVDPARVAGARERARTWRLGRWRVPLGIATLMLWGGMLALPVIGLIWRAGRVSGRAARGEPPHWSLGGLLGTLARAWPDVVEPAALAYDPLRSPLLATTLWSALGAMLAVAIAWGLAWKCRASGLWRGIALAIVALDLAAPGPIAGLSLKLAYHAPWPAADASTLARAAFAVQTFLHDTPAVLVLAYAQRTLPFAVLLLWPAVLGLPREFLDSAAVDGYGPGGVVRRVALPLTRGAIVAAWSVAFALALGELPASHLVLPPGHMTLSTRVWMLLHTGVESHLAGVGLILLGVYGLAGVAALEALNATRRIGR